MKKSVPVLAAFAVLTLSLTGCKDPGGNSYHPWNPAQDINPSTATTAPASGAHRDGSAYIDEECSPPGAYSPHRLFVCKDVGILGGSDHRWEPA